MPSRAVVDTHALIWFLVGSPRLGAGARAVLEDPDCTLFLPIIALAEACWIVEKGKAPTIPSVNVLLASVKSDQRVIVVPLDLDILNRSLSLTPIVEMHDRLIVATTLWLTDLSEPIALLTADANITGSGLVPVIW